MESALGRLGDRTVDSVAKLRQSDRFRNQMVRLLRVPFSVVKFSLSSPIRTVFLFSPF